MAETGPGVLEGVALQTTGRDVRVWDRRCSETCSSKNGLAA